jgi:hypothetical protein
MFPRLMLLINVSLLPRLDSPLEPCIAHAARIDPAMKILTLFALRREGPDGWGDSMRRHQGARAERAHV